MTVIFDFDGTLADTFITSIRIFEKLTKKSQPYSEEEILRLRGFTALRVAKELRIRPWRLPWLLVRGRAMMRREIDTIEVFDGIAPMLRQLQTSGVRVHIMSSNSPGNIRKLLKARGLDRYFDRIYGNVGLFGKAKLLRRVLRRDKLDAKATYYVGDEGRDIEAAKRVGVHSIAVTWGFNAHEVLERHHPDYIVDSPRELAEVLRKLPAA